MRSCCRIVLGKSCRSPTGNRSSNGPMESIGKTRPESVSPSTPRSDAPKTSVTS